MKRSWAAGTTFVLLLALYAATAFRTVGPGDSTELTVACSTWGVPHAPGYPLLCLVGNLVSHALPAPDPSLPLNLLDALFGALAAALVAECVVVTTACAPAGLVAGLALGTSRVFWLQSLAIEVFTLNALFAAALLLVVGRVLRSPEDPRVVRPALVAGVLLATTVVTHHTTLVLLLVPVAGVLASVLVRPAHRRALAGSRSWLVGRGALALVLGLLPLVYVPIASHFEPALDWDDVHDLPGFLHLLLRRDYGTGTLMDPATVIGEVMRHGEAASPLHGRHLLRFVADVPQSFGWAFVVLVVLGIVWAWQQRRPLAWLLAGYLVLLELFLARVNTPLVPLYFSVTERQYVLPHVVLALFAGLGAAFVLERVRRWRRATAAALLAATALAMGVAHLLEVDQRTNTFTRDFSRNLMVGVPEHAIVLTLGDLFHYGSLYEQECEHARRDLVLVSQDVLDAAWYQGQLARRAVVRLPARADRLPGSLADVLAANADAAGVHGGRPVVAVKLSDPAAAARYRMLPIGIWSRVAPKTFRPDPLPWLIEYARTVRRWDLHSLERTYPETSWEASQQVFYGYAIGQLQGLSDVAARMGGTGVAARPLPRLARSQTAAIMAYRADAIATALADSVIVVPEGDRADLARLALHWAQASAALDSANVQALETMAQLLADRPELQDAEYAVRRRIVELQPGDRDDLVPYLRLALRLAREHADRRISLLADAERVRDRYVRLLRIARALSGDPRFEGLARQWSGPLEELPELHASGV